MSSSAALLLVGFVTLGTSALEAQNLPAGTPIQVRLRQTISTFGTANGAELHAIVIAPVEAEGAIVIPLGAEITGYVANVHRVGFGFSRESAALDLEFDSIRLPEGASVAIATKVVDLDNSRETVDMKGRIHGIRATASFSSVISGLAVSAASFDPMLLAFGLTSSLSVFRIPESEIVIPVGSELHLELTGPLALSTHFPPAYRSIDSSNSQQASLLSTIRQLPFRTVTQNTALPSDLTNLVLLGTEKAVRAAFDASGWSETDAQNAKSTYGAMRSIVENQGYKEAPMSTLVLDGKPPLVTYAKTLNTFFQRHHLRVFVSDTKVGNQEVWTASSTHDSGIGFAVGAKNFIHLIDEKIDEERNKILNDLILTGCVAAAEFVERPWLPENVSNSTGDHLITDRRIAVIQLNDCSNPVRSDVPVVNQLTLSTRPSVILRITRNTALTLRNDLLRGNIAYQGFQGTKLALKTLRKPGGSPLPGSMAFGGEEWKIVHRGKDIHTVQGAPKDPSNRIRLAEPEKAAAEGYETFLELSLSSGYLRFGNDRFSNQPLNFAFNSSVGGLQTRIDADTRLRPGWNLTGNVTFNASRYFSHELGFTYNRTKLRIELQNPLIPGDALKFDADIRQFNYALLVHLRPNGTRLRPYAAVGAGMQMIRLTESQEKGNSILKFAFKEVNILYSAFRFGGDPPLEGGGIFQPTLNYGAGVKFQATRRLVFRADFRETLSAQPDFWTKSQQTLRDALSDDSLTLTAGRVVKYGLLRTQRVSLGVGITF